MSLIETIREGRFYAEVESLGFSGPGYDQEFPNSAVCTRGEEKLIITGDHATYDGRGTEKSGTLKEMLDHLKRLPR